MDTAKTIQELAAATKVNAEDELPVAQETGTEAKKATVQQLAAAVDEINAAGPYAELSAAVAQGKNLLAQNLTVKGVPTTAAETLVQMADKVNNLNVDASREMIKGVMAQSRTQIASRTWLYYIMPQRYTVVYDAGQLHVIPSNGQYEDFEAMLAGAGYTLAIDYTPTRLGCSEDGKTLVAYCLSDNSFRLYGLNLEDGVLTLADTQSPGNIITASSNYAVDNAITVSNDRKYILWSGNYHNIGFWNIEKQTGNRFSETPICNGGSEYLRHMWIDTENNYLYGISFRGGWVRRADFTIDPESGTMSLANGTLLASFPNEIGSPGGMQGCAAFDYTHKIAYSMYFDNIPNDSPGQRDAVLNVFVYDMGVAQPVLKTLQIPIMPSSVNPDTTSYTYVYIYGGKRPMLIANADETKFTFACGCLRDYIVYDRAAGEIKNTAPTGVNIMGSAYISGSAWCYAGCYGSTLNYDAVNQTSISVYADGIMGVSGSGTGHIEKGRIAQIFAGLRRTANGQTTRYQPGYMSFDNITSGRFDLDTTITPALPDEGA